MSYLALNGRAFPIWTSEPGVGRDKSTELTRKMDADGMAAYSELQQAEFAAEARGFTATRHQREVGTSYFDAVSTTVSAGMSSTTAMKDSTETHQF